MRKLTVIAICVGVVGISQMALGTTDSQRPAGREVEAPFKTTGFESCLEFDEEGDPIWYGEASAELNNMEADLAEVVDDWNNIAGAAFCTHYNGIAVFVKSGAAGTISRLQEIAKAYPQFLLEIAEVPRSINEMLALMNEVSARIDLDEIGMVALSPDMFTGGIKVSVLDRAQSDTAAKAISGIIGKDVAVKTGIQEHLPDTMVGRYNDFAPHSMGAALCLNGTNCNVNSTNRCSTGVPVTVRGIKMMLTAGHCVAGQHYNGTRNVGSQYTTAYPGNANLYGDWKLVSGSTYSKTVYNGSLTGTSLLPITAANWGLRTVGGGVCTSGSTTGQICRYKVIDRNISILFSDGVRTNYLTSMKHDSTGGNGYDTNGSKGGDSGGPCYYANGDGVTVMGIVKGGPNHLAPGSHPIYYCTQLNALKSWAPAASF